MPNHDPILNEEDFRALQALDTCSVANAIERFRLQLRNEGYTEGGLTCRFPEMPSMLGYAFTLQVRSYAPPTKRSAYDFENTSWWESFLTVPAPRILVVQDMDQVPGAGALVGELHAEILKAMGGVGVVTNGAVRDVQRVRALDFHMFSNHLTVSHSYCHVVNSSGPVQINGLEIKTGDLLHGDLHGVVRVPPNLAARIAPAVAEARGKEAEIAAYCKSPGFSLEELRALLKG